MKIVRIGYIISYVGNNGPANILYNLIKYLPKDIFKVYLFIIDEKNKDKGNQRFKDLGVEIIHLHLSKTKIFFYNKKKLEEIILKNKIELMHSHCLPSALLINNLKCCKKVSTIHCDFRKDFRLANGYLKGKIMEMLYINSLKKMHMNICCSQSIKKSVEKYSNIITKFIRNGVDIEKYTLSENKKILRNKLGLDAGKVYIISVGSLIKRKDPYFIANIFDELNFKNMKLILLGSSYKNNIVEKNIKNLKNKNIIILGNKENVNEYLNAADYFVSSSLAEGLPNSVLEACCAKLPLLLSDIEPHKEIISINYEAGFLYKVGNNNSFKENFEKLIDSNYEEKSKASFNIVNTELNAFKMSKNYEYEYNFLLGVRRIENEKNNNMYRVSWDRFEFDN